mgnify:CR=1 FL=1
MKRKTKAIKYTEKEAEKFVDDFFSGPKLKKKLNSKEIKKIILGQYENKYLRI